MPYTVLDQQTWHTRRDAHHARVDGWLEGHRQRRRAGGRHPVEDFLFTYYSYRPARLRRWYPGMDVVLDGADPAGFGPPYVMGGDGYVRVDVAAIDPKRLASIEWIHRLLNATASRQPNFGCFGMHEWAMVYRQSPEETRHNILPLRIGVQATAALVDEITVKCSHFDAFRFFTPQARPRNAVQLTRETQLDNEQPGCLHANMDLYKWAYKCAPLVSSELIADCFQLAREIRALDMSASPYDLTDLGYPPIRVETPEGRAQYAAAQREFADRATVLRGRLIEACTAALAGQPIDAR